MEQSQCMTSEKSHYSGTMNGTIFVVASGGGVEALRLPAVKGRRSQAC